MKVDANTRFWEKVDKTDNGCWNWTAGRFSNGYGQFWTGERKQCAHRFAYESVSGSIAAGLELDHLCKNVRCVKPSHLEPVTSRVNTLRSNSFSAKNAVKTHCPQGHPYDEQNTYWRKIGKNGMGRDCRECRREVTRIANRRRYKALRGANYRGRF